MIEMEGTIVEVLPGTKFMVEVGDKEKKHMVKCVLAGRLRKNYIKILNGDSVVINISPYDINNGIIVWRNR
jgi:translation initiation factor IF-1